MIKKNAALLTLQQTNWAKALASQSQEEQLDQEERTIPAGWCYPCPHPAQQSSPWSAGTPVQATLSTKKQAIYFREKISMSKRSSLHSMNTFTIVAEMTRDCVKSLEGDPNQNSRQQSQVMFNLFWLLELWSGHPKGFWLSAPRLLCNL